MTATVIIVVLVIGFLLLFTEVAVVPGFGVAGILGVLALGAGAVAAWTELGPFWGGVTGGVSVVAAFIMLLWLPKSRAGRKMVLEHSQAHAASQKDRRELLGRRGVTVTPLRPSGRVRFGSDEVDVVTEGEYIDRQQEVEVMTVEGARVVVRVPEPS
ncbi:MAG: NfeD family protein [Deltaproteobacteria bacterium]|jgi:membrane-bound serine protease (ClpP class)|nr:NfeD family protein [Deltaproteobacteria bacterium]